jgi:hypothetical protein
MPRKYLDNSKKDWLEQLESGKSEKWISQHYEVDVRTVRRGIEEMRRKKDAALAHTELIKDALKRHQDYLLDGLDSLISQIILPDIYSEPLSWQHDDQSIFSPTYHFSIPFGDMKKGKISVQQLLKEHLRNDRLWKELEKWENVWLKHTEAKATFQVKIVSVLEQETGCKIADKELPVPFLYSYTAGHFVYSHVLQRAIGKSTKANMDLDLSTDARNGEVRFHGSILATNPGHEEMTKQKLIQAIKKLSEEPEVSLVIRTYTALEEITTKIQDIIAQIKMIGIISGRCPICRRLGI